MRYLGLDLGTKTLGISISDKLGIIASTYKTLKFEESNYEQVIPQLIEIINNENIDCIVLGFPKNMNNTHGDAIKRTIEFKEILNKNINVKIELQDERLTTKQADSYMIEAGLTRKKRKQKIDSLAANIILQSYLDKLKGGNYGK